MGGGLSAQSRTYGLGVDQVVQFEVVLPDGTTAVALQWNRVKKGRCRFRGRAVVYWLYSIALDLNQHRPHNDVLLPVV